MWFETESLRIMQTIEETICMEAYEFLHPELLTFDKVCITLLYYSLSLLCALTPPPTVISTSLPLTSTTKFRNGWQRIGRISNEKVHYHSAVHYSPKNFAIC